MPFLPIIVLACSEEERERPAVDPPHSAIPTEHSAAWITTTTLPGDLLLDPDAVYAFDADWRLAASEVRAQADLQISWQGKAADAWGLARPADSFEVLLLLRTTATRADALERLARDDLEPVTTGRWSLAVEGRTDAFLSELEGFDPLRLREDDALTWLLLLADEVGPRLDLRDGVVLVPKADRKGFIVLPLSDGIGATSWTVDFSNDPLRTDQGQPSYAIDWSGLETDAYGKASDPARTDEVFVGRFDEVDEVDDLGGRILELQAAASAWWTVVPGQGRQAGTAALSEALDAEGQPFPGFTADGNWLVGGRCSTCFGPAPLWLAEVEARAP